MTIGKRLAAIVQSLNIHGFDREPPKLRRDHLLSFFRRSQRLCPPQDAIDTQDSSSEKRIVRHESHTLVIANPTTSRETSEPTFELIGGDRPMTDEAIEAMARMLIDLIEREDSTAK